MKVFITGGAGYLGSILVPELLGEGHKITVLDNFMYKQNSLAAVCSNKKLDIVRGDTRDQSLIKKLIKSADVIIPLAALVGAPSCDQDPIGANSTNTEAVKHIVKNLSEEQRIIMPITNSGYGIGEGAVLCTEETPLRPISLYGQTKVKAEEIVLSHENGVSLRLATVFGMSPRMRLDLLVNDFVYRATMDRAITLFESHFKRNYIHVRDVARAFQHTVNKFQLLKGGAYNIGLSDTNISKLELCTKIKVHLPNFVFMEAPIGEDPDKRDYIVSNEKIEKTGYNTIYTLDDGIDELIKGYEMLRNNSYSNI